MNQKGQNNHNARMTEDDACKVCQLLSSSPAPYREIAVLAGVSHGQVKNIAKRQTWLHVSQAFSFKQRAITQQRSRMN